MDVEGAVADIGEPIAPPVEPEIPDTGAPEPTTEQPIVPGSEREAPTVEGDERISDERIRTALKTIRETNPELAKAADELRKAYFSQPQWTESFKTPADAKKAKLAWDAVGGETGFADLRDKEQWINWVDQAAESGDPSIAEDWARDFPDGFRRAMPAALNTFARMDQQGFDQAMVPHFSGFLDRAQLGERLRQAYFAIQNNNGKGAQGILSDIFDWVDAYHKYAQQGSSQAADPRQEKLAQWEQQLNTRESESFRNEIGRQTYAYLQSSIQDALRPYLTRSKLSEQARARLIATINADVDKNLDSDDGYKRQVRAFFAKKDSPGAITYIKGHVDNIIQDIVKTAHQDLYGSAPRAPRAPLPQPAAPQNGRNGQNGQNQTLASAIKLPRKPAMSEIEKRGPDWMSAYMKGYAMMATGPHKGRLVQWG